MKGITPVISIIILLLIAISLGGSAYTFIFGYQEIYTSKTIKMVEGSAISDRLVIMNMGTATIDVSDDIKVEVNGKPAIIVTNGGSGNGGGSGN